MKLSEIINCLGAFAPFSLQESYDNSGVQVGDINAEIKSALLCLDITEEVVDEAIKKKCNLIISHHPIIFSGLKSITGRNQTERVVIKAIKNEINILSVHTNLDSVANGVSYRLAQKIGLSDINILKPIEHLLKKLVFFVPKDYAEKVRLAVFEAGAGNIGNYDYCSFSTEGMGTFRANESANPFVGEKGKIHREEELRVETILPSFVLNRVVKAMVLAHPYEEVAYDIYPLDNLYHKGGMGAIGELKEEMEIHKFLKNLKKVSLATNVRTTKPVKDKVKRIAVCGGSGAFLLNEAIRKKADVFVSGDFKYHQFFEAENKIVIADIGHFESEQFTKEIFYDLVTNKFPKFAVYLSETNTNPIINI